MVEDQSVAKEMFVKLRGGEQFGKSLALTGMTCD